MNKQYSFLAGLPRSGSTLLSSIIAQNPKMHAEGTTTVCDLISSAVNISMDGNGENWEENIMVGRKEEAIQRVIRSIPDTYYQDVDRPFILDKSRSWTHPSNVKNIKKFITDKPKIIVMVRPLEEIAFSFIRIHKNNGWDESHSFYFLFGDNQILSKEVDAVILARKCNRGEYLFVHYDDLVFETEKTLKQIYDFCEWPSYIHQLSDIKRPFVQLDHYHNMVGLHDVRKTIEKQKYQIELPQYVYENCLDMNSLILGK